MHDKYGYLALPDLGYIAHGIGIWTPGGFFGFFSSTMQIRMDGENTTPLGVGKRTSGSCLGSFQAREWI